MSLEPIRVLITGAAGNISYSLIPMILNGGVFGNDQPIILHLLEVPTALHALNGVIMEIEDCAFDLLRGIVATSDLKEAFDDIDVAFLVGAMPRREGMERKDLLAANVKIFKEQGSALNEYAKRSVLVLVVGNPANTNCYVCATCAPDISRKNFSAMTFLDQNRARAQIAKFARTPVCNVRKVYIWGNHSSTLVVDPNRAVILGDDFYRPRVMDRPSIKDWVDDCLTKSVQKRGAEVIKARKASSAMSAAKAAADHMKAWWNYSFSDGVVSMAVLYDKAEEDYHIPNDLVFSFPVKIANREWSIVRSEFDYNSIRYYLDNTIKELVQERNEAKLLCNL